jgi:hypothetical protein
MLEMIDRMNTVAAVLAIALTLGLPAPVLGAEEEPNKAPEPKSLVTPESRAETGEKTPSGGVKTFDALAVRPVTFVSSVFSTGAFVFALPFAALDPALDVEKTRRNLVEEPFRDTFQRPLGEFNGSAWGDP